MSETRTALGFEKTYDDEETHITHRPTQIPRAMEWFATDASLGRVYNVTDMASCTWLGDDYIELSLAAKGGYCRKGTWRMHCRTRHCQIC